MRRDAFGAGYPGELAAIGGDEVAFVPAPLPPSIEMGAPLWRLLVGARERIGRLDGITQNLPDPGLLLRPLQQREALRSSSIEGTIATPSQLLLFELTPREPTSHSDPASTWQEVANYHEALQLGTGGLGEAISLVTVRQLHQILMAGVRGEDKSPGAFRTDQVFIGSDHRFTPPPPSHLTTCLDALQAYLRAPSDDLDPLLRCFLVHYQFEAIHPFRDGNGRVGRLLLSLMTKEWLGLTRPWLYLSAYLDAHKDEYIDRLFAVSVRGAWNAWLEFCLRATIAQAGDAIDRCSRLLALRADYQDRLAQAGGHVRLVGLVDQLFSNPFIRITGARDRLKVTYPTAQTDIERLVKTGILTEIADASPRTFYARELFEIAFAEPGAPAPTP